MKKEKLAEESRLSGWTTVYREGDKYFAVLENISVHPWKDRDYPTQTREISQKDALEFVERVQREKAERLAERQQREDAAAVYDAWLASLPESIGDLIVDRKSLEDHAGGDLIVVRKKWIAGNRGYFNVPLPQKPISSDDFKSWINREYADWVKFEFGE